MVDVVDFKAAQNNRSHKRKEAGLKAIKDSFRAARESNQSKSKSAEKLKKLFRSKSPKKSK